jgi:hypothetical protein
MHPPLARWPSSSTQWFASAELSRPRSSRACEFVVLCADRPVPKVVTDIECHYAVTVLTGLGWRLTAPGRPSVARPVYPLLRVFPAWDFAVALDEFFASVEPAFDSCPLDGLAMTSPPPACCVSTQRCTAPHRQSPARRRDAPSPCSSRLSPCLSMWPHLAIPAR